MKLYLLVIFLCLGVQYSWAQKRPNKMAATLTANYTSGYIEYGIQGDSVRYNSIGRSLELDFVGAPVFMRLDVFNTAPNQDFTHFEAKYHLGGVVFCGKRIQFPLSGCIGGFKHKNPEYKVGGIIVGASGNARLFLTPKLAIVGGGQAKLLIPSKINGEAVPEKSEDSLVNVHYSVGLCYAFTIRVK